MKNKILLSAFVVAILASFAASWGYLSQASGKVGDEYGKFYQNAEQLGENYSTCLIKEDTLDEHTESELENAPVILKGKHNGSRSYFADCSIQEVVVEKVIKGAPESLVGKTIKIETPFYFDPNWDNYIHFSLINHMQKDHNYLLFLEAHGSTMNDPDGIPGSDTYTIGLSNIFGYLDYKNQNDVTADTFLSKKDIKLVKSGNGGDVIAPYSKQKQNEFFVFDRKSLDKAYKMKANAFSKYGESLEN